MNAVVMAHGLIQGGPQGAKTALESFWKSVADAALLSPFRRGPLEILTGMWTLDYSPAFIAADMAARLYSPYTMNVGGANPLHSILNECVDFGQLGKGGPKL
jgi:NTE family protein